MDHETLIMPVNEASPAGEDLVYTPAFQELAALADYLAAKLELAEFERLARVEYQGDNAESDLRVAESNVADGRRKLDRAEAAVKEITGRSASQPSARAALREGAERLLQQAGKDLRVVQHLALALLLEDGVTGLRDGFHLVDVLLGRFGDALHPRPDEDDPGDVSAREMVVSELVNGDAFVAGLRETAFLESPAGRFTGRDAEVIDGRLLDDGAGGPRSVQDLAALARAAAPDADVASDLLRARVAALDQCLEAAQQAVGRFAPGAIHGDRVLKLLQRARGLLQSAAADPAERAALAGTDPVQQAAAAAPAGTRAIPYQGNGAATGSLRNRDDARRLILEISRFLEETEPSHPAPFFLKRAERLLGAKDFFAIMRDMAPDALAEMERITGHRDSGSDSP